MKLKILPSNVFTLTLFMYLIVDVRTEKQEEVVFQFKEFDNVESAKNEIAFREWEAACEQTPNCLGLSQLNKTKCVRKCMSPSCYTELYAFDELEEGEIDIRAASFFFCFGYHQRKRFE